ncbi:[citrate (pro-3S)-lyase] ligase, partial [Klebsiella pneumoniae]
VDDCHNQIDLQLFCELLAPALKITHRFVGTEPLCSLTRHSNQRMKALRAAPGDAPPVEVVELARIEKNGGPISAS